MLSRRSHGENCVHDPGRIDVVDIIAGETRKLQVAGFRVRIDSSCCVPSNA